MCHGGPDESGLTADIRFKAWHLLMDCHGLITDVFCDLIISRRLRKGGLNRRLIIIFNTCQQANLVFVSVGG
jgi:hypothetical protein